MKITQSIVSFILSFFIGIVNLSASNAVLVTKKMLLNQAEESAFIPGWLLVLIIALVVLFTVLLILSPVGSNKRRGRRRAILRK
jgi:hypothetical protein